MCGTCRFLRTKAPSWAVPTRIRMARSGTYTIPEEPLKKQRHQDQYFQQHGHTLLADYLAQELQQQERILFENEHFVALVPFWAVWPFEAMLIPRRPMARITEVSEAEARAFAAAYRQLHDSLRQPV